MPVYKYTAVDYLGKRRDGTIDAPAKTKARTELTKRRLRVISIKLESGQADATTQQDDNRILGDFLYRDDKGKIQIQLGKDMPSDKHIIVFTKQFATMLASGVPLIQSLSILGDQQQSRYFGRILKQIRTKVENGATLSDGLEAHKEIFDTLYVAMVKAGEASGNLDTILIKLVSYIEKSAKIKSQVKSAMMYPMIIIVVALSVIAGLLGFVVPIFAKQYKDSGQQLPELTQMVIDFSNMFAANWMTILGGGFAVIAGLRTAMKTPRGEIIFDDIILKAPGIGQLLRKIAVGRFCSTMASMLKSGVNLLEALAICAASSGNKTVETFILGVRTGLEQGQKFSEPLAKGTLIPPMVVSMVSVGEATGALDDMLEKVSQFYEEVDLAVGAMLSMIEPILIVGIGGAVGFIVIAMYLPVFDMAGNVGG